MEEQLRRNGRWGARYSKQVHSVGCSARRWREPCLFGRKTLKAVKAVAEPQRSKLCIFLKIIC